ncbi:DoxX family protein [Chitinophaga ginsengisegetis]|uniref:DoxX family protein n=1 Tax=Chitinophaga ginsengisegetis TaxID=393003 RepID=UPI000DBA02B0|nr:DoxX family protein [Chitinophaga ginsengisegetis]MDR6569477.1 putative oxidoreductase [Chitinophaga ginsengisegetis]MDR6649210.1 putative oxidoreductase [Chitinophaga ginsengisegetis]MDR6655560.1 putative oxidoreductase [Chitinophaga ginsengisegetis]
MRKLFSAGYSNGAVSFSMLVLRLVSGGLILLHGWPKLINFTAKMNSFPDPLGVGHKISLGMVVFAEVFCAVLLIMGLLTRLASAPLVICMGVIIFMIHGHDPVSEKEMPILFLAAFVTLLFTGPGRFSLDGALGK